MARLILAPVLLGQAFFVRKRVRRLSEATGAREGRAGQGPLLRLLVIGDSSAAGVGVQTQDDALLGQLVQELANDYTVEYRLIGACGAKTADAVAWMSDVDTHFDVAVTALGVNDVTKLTPLPAFLNSQQQLWTLLKIQCDVNQVIVSGMPPLRLFPALPQPLRWVIGARAEEFRQALEARIAAAEGIDLLRFSPHFVAADMAEDGFHPGPKVYADWARAVAREVKPPRSLA